jgi:uncharacterized membrane protein YgdD (TMEM256/DUF423 family)
MNKKLYIAACILLAIAVINGAFGAHLLKALLDPAKLQAWQTAVLYQFIHALGILFLAGKAGNTHFHSGRIKIAGNLLLFGVILFSGSLYFLTTQNLLGLNLGFLGPITPIGGLLFIGGWIMALFSLKKGNSNGM